MSFLKVTALAGVACLVVFLGYRYVTYEPGYCRAEQRYISDAELFDFALRAREAEIAHYGGIDAYEKFFISLNRHPEEAGRDFDPKDPNCCQVYRGARAVRSNCGMGYPLCVRLYFPPRKDLPRYYERDGRTYFFDDCGKLQENF